MFPFVHSVYIQHKTIFQKKVPEIILGGMERNRQAYCTVFTPVHH